MRQLINIGLAQCSVTIAWMRATNATRSAAQGGVYMEKKAVDSSASMALRKETSRRRERDLAALLLAQRAARRISVDGYESVVWDEV